MQCCVTGPAFEYLLQQPNQALVQAVMLNSVAFTRMRSHQKGQLMDLLGRKGLHHMLNGQRQHILVRVLVLEPPPHVEWSTSTYTGKNPRIGAPSVSHCVLICLSLCLSACLPVCLSICLSACRLPGRLGVQTSLWPLYQTMFLYPKPLGSCKWALTQILLHESQHYSYISATSKMQGSFDAVAQWKAACVCRAWASHACTVGMASMIWRPWPMQMWAWLWGRQRPQLRPPSVTHIIPLQVCSSPHSVCASTHLLYSFLLYSFLLCSFLLYSFLLYSFLLYSFHLRLICLRLCFWRFCALHSRPSGKCHAGMLQFLACALVHEQSHAPHPQM